tara:strand:- start:547 stop:951 length:405 start_codon:yes stop_codon:yes gene_type:complete
MALNTTINDTPATVLGSCYGRLDNDTKFPGVSVITTDNIGPSALYVYPKYAQLVYDVGSAATQGVTLSAADKFVRFNTNQVIVTNTTASLNHVDLTLTSGLCCQIWVNPTSTTTTYLAVSGINTLNGLTVTLLG